MIFVLRLVWLESVRRLLWYEGAPKSMMAFLGDHCGVKDGDGVLKPANANLHTFDANATLYQFNMPGMSADKVDFFSFEKVMASWGADKLTRLDTKIETAMAAEDIRPTTFLALPCTLR